MRSSETIQHIQESMNFLKTMHGKQGNNGIRPFSDDWFSSSAADIANTYSVMKKFTQLKGMLPDSQKTPPCFLSGVKNLLLTEHARLLSFGGIGEFACPTLSACICVVGIKAVKRRTTMRIADSNLL